MPAYLFVVAKMKDADKFQEYAAGAGPTVASHGGKVLARGAVQETLVGDLSGDMALVIEFADTAAARKWYDSDEYQAMVPTREQAIDAQFLLIEPPPA